jgi:hypothetical protein
MMIRLIPIAAAGALMLMALAQSTPGTPLPNAQVGLEPQSGGPVLTATTTGPNAEAEITVTPGLYFVFVANGSTLPSGGALLTVIEGSQQRISGTIPRAAGRAYAPNATAQGRMVINWGVNGQVRLRLAHAVQAPVVPPCLTLPNGAPRFISAQGTTNGNGGGAYGAAMTAARAEWSRLARVHNAPGQPDYSDWARAAQTNASSSVRPGLPPTTVVTLTGQPCRRP